MKINATGRKINLKDAFLERAETKFLKFNRFFGDSATADLTVTVENGRQTVEITIRDNGMIFRAEDTAPDMTDALEKVCDILMRQICENKEKLERRLKKGAFDEIELFNVEPEETFKVVRSKRFEMKPMDVEEAILQMNLLGHLFFVFFNIESDCTSVVYRRNDGNYGLIEATLD